MHQFVQPTPQEIDAIIRSKGKDQIETRECKHATYAIHRDGTHDALVVKEWVTFKDHTRYPTLRVVEDYKRPYWVNKEGCRDHTDKIQFEDLSRVDAYKCRQMDLSQEIYRKIRYGSPSWSVKHLARKPFIYGCDFGSEVYLKQAYMEKWVDSFQPNLVTVIDAETNVWEEGYKPILWSEVNDHEVILYYDTRWVKDHPTYEDDVRALYEEFIPEYMDQIESKLTKNGKNKAPAWIDQVRRLPLRFVGREGDADITKACVDNLHLTQPDILTGWNVFFDINVIHETALRAGTTPDRWLADPRVPDEYKLAYIKEGPSRKMSAAGVEQHLAHFERWHTMLHTSSFRVCDSMQLYWQLRKAKGKENGGYGLDAVLNRQIGVGKAKANVKDSDVPPNTIHWHMEMQKYYKIPYGLYSLIDSVGLFCQEKKNSDLTSQISSLAGSADYSNFNSQPKINAVDMHFSAIRAQKKVICTTSDQMETELDKDVISRLGWIVTFPSHQVQDIGLFLFEDMPHIQSTIYMFGADADVETTYPTAEIIMNLGKEQTVAEPCYIKGVRDDIQRRQSINITGGRVNALEIMQSINGLKSLDEWADHIHSTYYSGATDVHINH